MSLFKLLENTVEGVLETTINTVKLPVTGLLAPFDDKELLKESVENIQRGLSKIGNSEKE